MSDELETLSDDKLNETFAVEVAGGTKVGADDQAIWHPPGTPDGCSAAWSIPAFSTDANIILMWLSKAGRWEADYSETSEPRGREYLVKVRNGVAHGPSCSSTFARAACIALIRAKRAQQPSP